VPEKSRTFLYNFRTFTSKRHEFCRKTGLGNDNLPTLRAEMGNWKLETRNWKLAESPPFGILT
jgi:hypothetical protein